jgi:hypothetical protein
VELSPETCRVKPLRRINAIVASCWNYFTIEHINGKKHREICEHKEKEISDSNFLKETFFT